MSAIGLMRAASAAGGVCGACGHGDELQPLTIWRDADGEDWWIHPLCAEHYGITTEAAPSLEKE